MRKIYTSPEVEIVNYSTPDVMQVISSPTFDFNTDPSASSLSKAYTSLHD